MSKEKDYTGVRFGQLTVVGCAGYRTLGNRPTRHLKCRCDCGREREIPRPYLTSGSVTVCDVCRRGPCVVCGKPVERDGRKNTCSDDCEVEKTRANALRFYHNMDGERKQRYIAYQRSRQHLYRKNESEQQKQLRSERYKAWYQENRERVAAHRREKRRKD